MQKKRALSEEFFPLEDVSTECAKERIHPRKGSLTTLHVWWSRKPRVAARSIIYSSLIPFDDHLLRSEFLTELKKICSWEHSNDKELIETARHQIRSTYGNKKPKVLDLFAGGGTIPFEALRLGCDAYAIELNPVAHIIQLCSIVYPQKYGNKLTNPQNRQKNQSPYRLVSEIKKWAYILLENVRKEIGFLYEAASNEVPIAFIWARTIACGSCNQEIPLLNNFWLSKKRNAKVALKLQIDNTEPKFSFRIVQNNQIDFDPSKGTIKRGYVKCPFCSQISPPDYVRNWGQNKGLKDRLIVVVLKASKGRKYRLATDEDIFIYQKAEFVIQNYLKKDIDIIPNEPAPPKEALGCSNAYYGLRDWNDFYNNRQLVVLATFFKKLQELYPQVCKEHDTEYAKAIVTYLGLAIDRLADYNSVLSTWLVRQLPSKIAHVFVRPTLSMAWGYAESNPFGESSGSWVIILDYLLKSVEMCCKVTSDPAIVHLASATNLPYENDYFEAIITDPPYWDNMSYSDLSDFFYVLLKRSIGFLYPDVFRTPLTPKSNEIVHNPRRFNRDKTQATSFFVTQLTQAFKEGYRVLKPDGIFVIMFTHKSTSAWKSLIQSLMVAGFVVSASWPVHTERAYRLRAMGSAAVGSTIFLVCRKKPKRIKSGLVTDLHSNLSQLLSEKLEKIWALGIRGVDLFISSIGPGLEVYGQYKEIYYLTGEEFTLDELFELLRKLVIRYILKKVLIESDDSKMDPITQFHILWRWFYRNSDISYNEANLLAKALGIETNELKKKRIIKTKGSSVSLLSALERSKLLPIHVEIEQVTQQDIIDLIHISCFRWEQGEREQLSVFLSKMPAEVQYPFWTTIQVLTEILASSTEKQVLQGLLTFKKAF
ncbi:MAG: DUF1156 domain-containing protein [Candidatus Hermodarchaeota archaeon]